MAKQPVPRRGLSRLSTTAGLTVAALLVAGTIAGMQLAGDRGSGSGSQTDQGTAEQEAPTVVPTMPATSAAPGTTAGAPPETTKPGGPENLVPDPGFETGLSGWRSVGGAILTRQQGGRDGGWAARVAPGAHSDGAPGLSLPDAAKSKPRQLYHANGWIRSDRPGTVLTIALYEQADGRPAHENVLGMRLPDTGWHQFGTIHQTAVPGSDLSFVIAARQLPEDAWFEVDQVVLHEL